MNSDYSLALHALVYLSHRQDVVSSEELAENICTNPSRVRKVLSKLKKAGLVETREGNVGGSRFVGDPEAMTLAQVADALKVRFVETNWHSGRIDRKCLICSGMAGVMDELLLDLDDRCRARLSELTIADLHRRLMEPEAALVESAPSAGHLDEFCTR